MDAQSLIRQASGRLEAAEIPEAPREAEQLLLHVTGADRVALYRDNPDISSDAQARFEALVTRRTLREPMHYILGELEFMGVRLKIGPGLLVPRPETELLVTEAIRILDPTRRTHVLDLCTGSGAIALALARALPRSEVTATDISPDAIHYAMLSARMNQLSNVRFLEGHMFVPAEGMMFEMIVSNPPYIPTDEIDPLMPEVSKWEPREALDGGPDGLDFYREILTGAPCYLDPPGWVLMELGAGQAPDVAAIAEHTGLYETPSFINDLAGHQRVGVFKLKDKSINARVCSR